MTTQDLNNRISKASILGKEFFNNGGKRIPYLCKGMHSLWEGLQIGEGIEISQSFIDAWDKENLKN